MARTVNCLVALWRSTRSSWTLRKGERIDTFVSGAESESGMSEALARGIEVAKSNFNTKDSQAKTLRIFLAPEYFFAHKEHTDPSHALERGEKNTMLSKLVVMSRNAPNMLIVPGTIAWRMALDAPSKKGADNVAERRRQKAIEEYKADFQFKQDKDLNASAYQEYVEKDLEKMKSSTDFGYLKRNTCYIAFNGKVLKYHKRAGFGEEKQDKNAVFVSGHQAGFFTISWIRFGIEVCFDHNQGYLRASMTGGTPHVHLIISNSTDGNPSNMVCSAFAAHSSTSITETKLMPAPDFDRAKPYAKVTAVEGVADLELYEAAITDSLPGEDGLSGSVAIQSETLSEKTGIVTN